MDCRFLLITNNPKFISLVSPMEMLKTSQDVLIRSRDLVHAGHKLVTHPLYGNLRPYQQPFRSVLLEMVPDASTADVDQYSLELMENALSVYRSCQDRILDPGVLPSETEEDYAFIDLELMKKSLLEHGLVTRDRI
ncbi:MAG: GrdX family protein [Synergistales bacterium]|nr:GrdX family protein [Synergistales bacterium]